MPQKPKNPLRDNGLVGGTGGIRTLGSAYSSVFARDTHSETLRHGTLKRADLGPDLGLETRLLQDETQTHDSKALSRWFASRPNARQEARNVAAEIQSKEKR